ncbi:hypothetical protein E3N88_11952 [Mikania micrantha]|uniref:Uncharacterized protein n=1 Tax=Mikania micrantha TaxID=192012 RepID=A0A5N6P646_9ASTR|nr:hypothetical protein E3N88_11952 [Mikania micrantha]
MCPKVHVMSFGSALLLMFWICTQLPGRFLLPGWGLEGWSYALGCRFLLANNGAGSVDVSLHVLWVSRAWQELQRACCEEYGEGLLECLTAKGLGGVRIGVVECIWMSKALLGGDMGVVMYWLAQPPPSCLCDWALDACGVLVGVWVHMPYFIESN